MLNPLDNPIWHALTGPHAKFALGRGHARHYPRDMAPFAGIAEPSAAAYADLAAAFPTGAEAVLFRPAAEPVPAGWEALEARPIDQMILPDGGPLPERKQTEVTPVALGLEDAADMLALVDATKPGPFNPQTVELGRYVGVRDPNGRLIAICVHPDAQGQGLGAAVTRNVARAARARGEVPVLHVWSDNPAREVYMRAGFRLWAKLWVLWRRPVADRAAE